MQFRLNVIPLAVMALAAQGVLAQQAEAPKKDDVTKLEKVVVTGSLIKRTDKETPAVVQTISRKDIQSSGYATMEELLRSTSAIDASSVQDGAASGFVGGLATLSMRGFGSQGTLVLINGRRVAPVAAVDVNFGRGSLISVNNIPKGAIERVEILKDGASALYGSDAMAGVVNYILRKDYEGAEVSASHTVNDEGVGKTSTGSVSFGFGNIDRQGYNVFGGLEVTKRDPVWHRELKTRGLLDESNAYNNLFASGTSSGFNRFTPDSVASPWGSYYRVPTSNSGTSTIGGISVANNNPFGQHYLGTFPGCPDELTVGKGVANRPIGMGPSAPGFRTGQCRYNFDENDQAIAGQDRINAMVGANFALGKDFTLTANAILSRTKTTEIGFPQALTTTVVSSANPVASSWSTLNGTIMRQNALILPINHPDNPTRGTASPIPVQVIYRFADLAPKDVSELESARFTVGLTGSIGEWDIDSALMHSRQDNSRTLTNRLRKSLLDASLNPASPTFGQYHFTGVVNTPEAIASVASDAVVKGESTITSLDVRASRDLFAMKGGQAAVALGAEFRHEDLESVPDDVYKSGDYVGLVGNGTSGKRNLWAGFAEFRLPVAKQLELQAAARHERYSDFGSATTGKLGFKWDAVPSFMAVRGTVASGFRAPAISQIANTFLLSFHSFQNYTIQDPLRCNPNGGTDGKTPTSLSDPPVARDCNVLGRSAAGLLNPGSIPSIISANPNLKPETSRSATAGIVLAPTKDIDLALDAWYFQRNDEIRVQRGVDVMEAYLANPAANASVVIRDPNPATWLPGVANSGPIMAIMRGYGNYQWSKTSGIDYDLNIRFPKTEFGQFSLKLNGTYTTRFDQLILNGGVVDRYVGTWNSDIPKSRATATIKLDRDNWSVFGRLNHQDALSRLATTDTCLTSTSAPNLYQQNLNACWVGGETSYDIGFRIEPIKGLTVNATVLNVTNDYGRSSGIPNSFNFWDQGTSAQLGRRFSLSFNYELK